MKDVDLRAMHEVETDHWWFAGKRALFRRLLADRLERGGLRILDVGCGTGALSTELARFGTVWSVDSSAQALRFARERGAAHTIAADAAHLPFLRDSFDLVTAFDVVEHVADDAKMVRDLYDMIAPGGALAVHVPAWPSLFGPHDEILEHKRRYTRKQLGALLTGAGFRIEYLGWSTCAALPAAAVIRAFGRLAPGKHSAGADVYALPAPLNRAMYAWSRAESWFAQRFGLPFGVSLAAVAVVDPAKGGP